VIVIFLETTYGEDWFAVVRLYRLLVALLFTGLVNEKVSEVPALQLTEPPARGMAVSLHEPPGLGVSETRVVPVASLPSPDVKVTVY
jgi:hypothetical protein